MKFKNRQKKLNVKKVKREWFPGGGVGPTDGEGHKGDFGVLEIVCILMRGVVMCVHISGHNYRAVHM